MMSQNISSVISLLFCFYPIMLIYQENQSLFFNSAVVGVTVFVYMPMAAYKQL